MENHDASAAATGAAYTKRYAPPNQRNWWHGRRKSSGDPPERSSRGNDGVKNLIADYGESLPQKLIPLNGCCNSSASELLNNRWNAAMNAYESLPEDSLERPVLYESNNANPASPWRYSAFPQHLMINPNGRENLNRDFFAELRVAINDAANPKLLKRAQTQ